MDFALDKKHEMAQNVCSREFAENEVKPLAQEVDETEAFPAEQLLTKWQNTRLPGNSRFRRSTADRDVIPLTYANVCRGACQRSAVQQRVIVSAHTSLCI